MGKVDLKLPEINMGGNPAGDIPRKPPPAMKNYEKNKSEPWKEFEERDEKQIQLLTEGYIVNEPFYEKDEEKDGEKKIIYGISITGVMELAKAQKNLLLELPKDEHTELIFVYHIKATDVVKNISTIGTGEQPRFTSQTGYRTEDIFARRKAMSKAKRNALRDLLDPKIIESEFKAWYKNKHGKEIDHDQYNQIIIVQNIKPYI